MTFAAHAAILKDWAARKELPMEEPDEAMLSSGRIRAWNALYGAEIARAPAHTVGNVTVAREPSRGAGLPVDANAIATGVTGSISGDGVQGLVQVPNERQSRATIWAVAAATLAFGLAYAPNFRDLRSVWESDPNYSHGYLIIPIALVILWRRLSDVPAKPSLPQFRHPGGDGSP